MTRLVKYEDNLLGNDYVVGDIHGCYSELSEALVAIGFNRMRDRLFCTGDLIDRGTESHMAEEWINCGWFFSVRGNHDHWLATSTLPGADIGTWMANGGLWVGKHSPEELDRWAKLFDRLPYAIEIHYPEGIIGITHAGWKSPWQVLRDGIDLDDLHGRAIRDALLWDRSRVKEKLTDPIEGVKAVVCGHGPLKEPLVLGNVRHIDTMGWRPDKGGRFTILKLPELTIV